MSTTPPPSKTYGIQCSLLLLDLVKQLTGEGGTGPSVLGHARAARSLEAEDAVLAGHVAGHGDTALPAIGRRGAAARGGDGAAAHVLDGRLRGLGVGIGRLRGPSVALHLVRRRAVSAVEARVAAKELVVRLVRFVARAARQGVRHGE